MLIDKVVQKANELWMKPCMIYNNFGKYKEYLSEVLASITNVAIWGEIFQNE
jgi:hypothetical protein